MTFPENLPSVPVYRGWLGRGGIESEVCRLDDPCPKIADFDALLLPGGGDVNPERYGAPARHPATYGVNDEQDRRDERLFREFQAAGKPVFGICRGQQMVNVLLGGRLLQHVPDFLRSEDERHRQQDACDSKHPLQFVGRTGMADALHGAAWVNSAHHQAIDPASVGEGLTVVAISGRGIIEAVEQQVRGRVISTVQWHPERLPADHPASSALLAYWKSLV